MQTIIKTPSEIESMRLAGQMLARILDLLSGNVEAGISTKELSLQVTKELKKLGGEPAFLGYNGFPEPICISVNDEVVHGIPRSSKIINNGDVLSLDLGVRYKGMIVDSARTVTCGDVPPEITKLISVTESSLLEGLSVVKDGVKTGTIGNAIENVLNKSKLGIVRDLVGHGVGHHIHEDPNIPNYGRAGTGSVLRSGMTVAIEPMATLGKDGVYTDIDGWTVRTKDGSIAAHFEHTVLVTDRGCEILTAPTIAADIK